MKPPSRRELQVLHHLAQGDTDAEIASALKITKSTVSTYLHRIYLRFDVDNRTSAVMAALARGYFHVEPVEDDEDFSGVRVTGCADNDEDD